MQVRIRTMVLTLMLVVLGPGVLAAQTPTFSREVAPIFYENCASCHRAGEIAPMSLLTYDQTRPWARSIREQIVRGTMPPWHAEEPAGTFVNDRRLTETERTTIVNWVDNGAPEGDPADLPPAPRFAEGWAIGQPDAVVAMPAEFEVPARGEVAYQYFQAETGFTEDMWVQAIEVRPSEPSVVHHILVFSRSPDGEARQVAFRTANPPSQISREQRLARVVNRDRPRTGAAPVDRGVLIATTAPGTNALVLPPGQAMRIKAGSVLTFQIHYTANGQATTDRSRIGFVFADAPPRQEAFSRDFLNAGLLIPAGASNHRVDSAIEFVENAHITAIFPHTHLRGKSWEYRMVYPDGRSEIVLSLPDYDFNWQTYYEFADPLAAPAGSRLEATAHFDNSAANPGNPDPTADVAWGQQTWDEMQYTGITFVLDDDGSSP